MKKLISLTLVMLLLPFSALCATSSENPILGGWYVFMDTADLPSDPSIENATHAIIIVTFEENGNITHVEIDYNKDGTFNFVGPELVGKWEKDGNDYYSSIIAVAKEKMFFEDDILYIMLYNDSSYCGFRKMETLDVYHNIYRITR